MRDFFVVLFFLLAAVSACSSDEDGYDYARYIIDFELCKAAEEALENDIAVFLKQMPNVESAVVQLNDGTAVVGIDLNQKPTTRELYALKREIVTEVKNKNRDIKHVAVTTAPELYGRILNSSGTNIKYDSEIFELPAPMP